LVQEVADFTSGSIIGMLLAMFFRFWAFKKWVFPDDLGKRRRDNVIAEAGVTLLHPPK
jgi:putative flippase GtrA